MWSFFIMLKKYKKYDDYISGEKSQKINECQKSKKVEIIKNMKIEQKIIKVLKITMKV